MKFWSKLKEFFSMNNPEILEDSEIQNLPIEDLHEKLSQNISMQSGNRVVKEILKRLINRRIS